MEQFYLHILSIQSLCLVWKLSQQVYYTGMRQLCLITKLLFVDAAMTLVQSFISCHLDYCNSLFTGITDSLLRWLQSVQNAAARLVTGTRWRDHSTPVLRQLLWLPVQQRVDFKLALLVYKALHDAKAEYLVDDCQLVSHASGYDRPTSTLVLTELWNNTKSMIPA